MLIEKFITQVKKTPGKTAVKTGEKIFTYAELDNYADRIAGAIESVWPAQVEKAQVGLLLDHGVEMIAAILGVLKAGKVYVPLSPGYPLNRISYMLEDSNSGLVIIDSKCTEKTKEMILAKHIGFLNIDEIGENSLNFAFHSKMGGKNAEDRTAYIMYTSGSTGKPKGVIQTERNILYYIRNWTQRFSITEADRMTLFSSFCHDGSVQDMFGALLNGATLYPYDVKKRDESVNLSRFLIEEKITIWHSVPSLFNFFVNTLTGAELFKDLRWLLLGGEPFRGYEIDMFKKYFPGAYLANVYGQTESSVNSIWTISPADTIRQLIIGQPLDNTRIFVVDEEGNTVDPLEIGEIVIACPHISPGYWQNQELTDKNFSLHPEYGLVYWTGDLGRLLVDGNIEFMGRKDFQVKIRGFRVELGEIETALLRMDFIKEAVAVAKESETKGTYLCAFFTAQKEIPVSDLRNSLINELPDYMIPRHFIQLEKMPLTQSGKIDRKNLLTIEPVKTSTLLSQPEKDIEKKIAHIWAEVLNLDAVGLHDNIFEIGGNSFDIIKINNKLSDLLRMNIPMVKLFEYTTINDLTGYLTRLLEGKENAADNLKKYTSIEPAEKKEYYALSPGQKRLYILQQMVMANTSYNLPYVIRLKKYMEKEKLESVFKKLIERHESLRTCFIVLNEEPVQKINERINFSIPCSQITEIEAKCIISNFSKPFELSHAPLLRVELLNVDSTRQILLIDMHHIITDGVSQNILEKEFMALYTGEQLPPLKLQYKDYSEWQNSEPQKSLIRKQKEYWLEIFAEEVPVLNLPIDFTRPIMQSFAGSHVKILLPPQESKLLKDLAKQTGTTLYMCILSAFIILLSRLSGQEDIVIGTPIASRKHVDLAVLIGMFVNTLAIRNYPNNEKNYNDFLLELKENTLNAYQNQDYHFEDLVDNLPISRDTGRNPVFDVMFNLLNIDEYKGDIPQMEEELYVNSHQQGTAKFDLTLTMVELGERFLFTFEYCIHLFKPETIDRFIAYFKMLLHDIAENHDKKLWQLEIISEAEKHQLIYDFNKSHVDYHKNIPVHRLFEEHAAQWPDHIAVIYSAIKITYRELDTKAGLLAVKLKQNGVGPDNIVGINLDRSVEMIIGLLGILKSGGAYLPIDPDYPQERIDYMLKDSNTKILITNKSEIRNSKFETNPNDKLSGRPRRGLSCFDIRASDLNSANLAYVIYTSGSTGKPKGVSIQHRSIVNFIQSITRFVSFTAKTYVYSLTTISFDIFVLETLLPLTQGAAVTVGSRQEQINPSAAAQIMMREKITIFQSTPSRLQTMIVDTDAVKALGGLNYLLVGGEVFSPILLDKIKEIVKGKIYNLYGPTETTVWSTIKDVTGKQSLNIGGPISNTRIYILSPYGNLQPVGVFGELYIAGDGLARGYLNNPEMTAEKFIKNYRSYRSNRTNIFYRTGDLARWLPDGNIEIFGRIDSQVKIRGYRIELSEIEKQLITYPDVKEAVVTVHDHDGNKYLCAYFTSGIELNIAELRIFLAKILPTYMLPAYFMQIEKIPLTPNGKINSRALPAPDKKCNHRYAAPRDSIETSLTRLWADILTINVNLIGIDDSFFELGGNSLNAAILLSKIHQSFEVKLTLGDIFKNPYISNQGDLIKKAAGDKFSSIEVLEKKDYYSLSAAQKRLYFLQQLDPGSTAYNMPFIFPLGENIEISKLERILKKITFRHESLRTFFVSINEVPVQRVQEDISISSEFYDLTQKEPALFTSTDISRLSRHFFRPFDLSQAPLLRSGLLKNTDGSYTWMVDIHHIISDGTSHTILTGDFLSLYNKETLAPLHIQYKDFAHWQNHLLASQPVKKQENYWLNLYADAKDIPRLDLPMDFKRPPVFTFAGHSYKFILEKEYALDSRKLGMQNKGTLYMNFLAVLNVLFYKYTGQDDIIIGTGVAGRPHAELLQIVGMFVNTLAMRNNPHEDKTYESFLTEVISNSVTALENQDAQFEDLVERLQVERDVSRNPLFDITMVVQNFKRDVYMSTGETGKSNMPESFSVPGGNHDRHVPITYENSTAKFDMTFFVHENPNDISIMIEYYAAIFKEETIQRLARHLKQIIAEVTANPLIKIGDIEIISPQEKQELLADFNNTMTAYPREQTIHALFKEQAGQIPDTIALVFKDNMFSYRCLYEVSDQLAHYLNEGDGPGAEAAGKERIIGIMMDKSLEWIVAMLGILKSGGAYLPIDPEWPEERIKFIIDDSRLDLVVSQERWLRTLNKLQWECPAFNTFLCLDSADIDAAEEKEKNGLMDQKLWDYVVESAVDDITAGGWLTGSTGTPFTREEMAEYGDNALKKLTPLLHSKMRVLEIGCASGFTMYRAAPKVGYYLGTDLSPLTLERNKKKIAEKGYTNIGLACCAAHEVGNLGEKDFDLVIINSVIQSFHGHHYLRKVIRHCVNLLNGQGYLFIGDIMDQDLKNELIQDMVRCKESPVGTDRTKIDWSEELFVSRDFFRDLLYEIPALNSVEFSPKIYTIENELTKFRYDALFTIDKNREFAPFGNREKQSKRQKYQLDRRVLKQITQLPGQKVSVEKREQTGSKPMALAYVIYTSGSTGTPKGVLVEHYNVLRLVKNSNFITLKPGGRLLLNGAIAFDITTFETWGALLNGLSLYLIEKDCLLDLECLNREVFKNDITILHLIPQLFSRVLSEKPGLFAGLEYFLVGGDSVQPEPVNRLRSLYPHLKVLHMYGPTENTTFSTFLAVESNYPDRLPIGKPVSQSFVYVFDRSGHLQPAGVPGELYVGGAGVARGYLNNPELTRGAFEKAPLDPPKLLFIHHSPIYKTGDLARRLPDGNIEFLGRMHQQNQVKIRGIRIELAEIEKCLLEYPGITDAAMVAKTDEKGDICLYGYIVPRPDKEKEMAIPGMPGLKEYLAKHLPAYMIPAAIIPLAHFPLTSSGKLDRKKLPDPAKPVSGNYTPPRNQIEKQLTGIWMSILQRDETSTPIGIDDNFFELGGHSLLAAVMVSRIHKELDVKITLTDIFTYGNIRSLAGHIKNTPLYRYAAIESIEKQEYYPLSSAQKQMYVLQRLADTGVMYNIPMIIQLQGVLSREKTNDIFRQLIQRHENLRTSFHWLNDQPVQRVHDGIDFNLEYDTVENPVETKAFVVRKIKDFIRPFDLAKIPLFRAGLIKLAEQEYLLMIDIHHIISDGVSVMILNREFMSLYFGKELPGLRIQYKDYAHWHNLVLISGELAKQEAFWLKQFSSGVPRLNLPTDYNRPPVQVFKGEHLSFEIEKDLTAALKNLALSRGTTLYMVLLSAVVILLAKLSGQDDIVLGLTTAGRRHADLEPVIGNFITTLACRNYPQPTKTYSAFLEEVKKNTLAAFENQDYPFEYLVGKIPHRDKSRNPMFDVMFGLLNFKELSGEIPEAPEGHLKAVPGPYSFENKTAKMDMLWLAQERDEDLYVMVEFCTELFKRESVEKFIRYFQEIITGILKEPAQKISEISILSAAEKNKIVTLVSDKNNVDVEFEL